MNHTPLLMLEVLAAEHNKALRYDRPRHSFWARRREVAAVRRSAAAAPPAVEIVRQREPICAH